MNVNMQNVVASNIQALFDFSQKRILYRLIAKAELSSWLRMKICFFEK